MDALALLCTLHADGPATLRALRQAGCGSLHELDDLDVERLADVLELAPAGARRFLREARNLRARMGEDLLEREDAGAPRRREPAPPASSETPALGRSEETIMSRVLTAWRERDDSDEARARRETASTVAEELVDDDAPELVPATPRLRAGSLDGLTESCCRRLAEAGVTSVAELVERDALELARATDLGFTLIRRLQFLARRERARGATTRAATGSAATATVRVDTANEAERPAKFSAAGGPAPRTGWDYEILPRSVAGLAGAGAETDLASGGHAADAAGPFA